VGAFSVSVPAVDALSFRVLAAASDIRSAEGKLRANACTDVGYPDLTGALSSFQGFWDSFTDGTASAVEKTGGNISAAATAYQTVDSTVMVDPSISSSFVSSTLSGGGGAAQMLLGPLLPGAGSTAPSLGPPLPLPGSK
jgi:hypothetical protein